MGSSTEAEQVRFKIVVWCGDQCEDKSTGLPVLDAMHHYLEHTIYDYEWGKNKGQPLPPFNQRGWSLDERSGEYKSLLTDRFTKDKYEVHYVNESEDAAGGGERTCFFSDKKEALEQLCEDWGFDKTKIQEDCIVKQTL